MKHSAFASIFRPLLVAMFAAGIAFGPMLRSNALATPAARTTDVTVITIVFSILMARLPSMMVILGLGTELDRESP